MAGLREGGATEIGTAPRERLLVVAGAALFGLSTAFPVIASLVKAERPPIWIGLLDVTLALAVVLTTGAISAASRGRIDRAASERSSQVYQRLASVPLLLVALFFVLGDRVNWEVLLVGLGWRAWVLMFALPAAMALWDRPEADAEDTANHATANGHR